MKEIIKLLNDNGYEAYVVGGFVRNYVLGIESKDIDIATNAPISEIKKIFKGRGKSFDKYFAYHIEEDGYSYEITSFRKELKYKKNKPTELELVDDFKTDLLRRDFTINTFAINNKGLFVDLLDVKSDLDNKIIRVVGDTEKKLTEDKTRIVRAIRFACTLGFELDDEIKKFLKNKGNLINEVPREYIKNELDRIFSGDGYSQFFNILKKYKLSKYFNISFNNIKKAYDKYGIWAQVETTLPMSKAELTIINAIKELLNKGNVTFGEMTLYNDEVIYNAVNILDIEKKLKAYNEINELHSIIDINVDLEVIAKYFGYSNIKRVYKIVEKNIMEGNVPNDPYFIEKFLRDLRL